MLNSHLRSSDSLHEVDVVPVTPEKKPEMEMSPMGLKRHSDYCIGQRDEFSSWWAIIVLAMSWSLVVYCICPLDRVDQNPQQIVQSHIYPMDQTSESTEFLGAPGIHVPAHQVIVLIIRMIVSVAWAVFFSMVSMPRCGGVELERLRKTIILWKRKQRYIGSVLYYFMPRIRKESCCEGLRDVSLNERSGARED